MRETIEKILTIAVNAPSGNNAQPWRFGVGDNEVRIFNASDRDKTPYNFKQSGSYVAHGALIENIAIVAAEFGCLARAVLFPDQNNSDHIATIIFEAESASKDPLFAQITERATDRRVYKTAPMLPEHRDKILEAVSAIVGAEFRLFEDRGMIDRLARALGLHEKLIFENKMIHTTVFSKILWSKKDDEKKRLGLYIKTKFPDMPEPLLALTKPAGYWSVVQFFNKFGFSKKIYEQSVASCRAVSAIGAVLIDHDAPQDFIAAGRLFQRVWLAATQQGLRIQPVTGIPYLARRIAAGVTDGFSVDQVREIIAADRTIRETVNSGEGIVAMIFRLGYDDKPAVRTSKLPPEII